MLSNKTEIEGDTPRKVVLQGREADLYKVIVAVRAAFNRLKSFADDLHEDLGITAAMRAVLEHLATRGPDTVPRIATTKGVSRQHIQTIVNSLLDDALVDLRENPAHARSSLVVLTTVGAQRFAVIRAREQHHLSRLAAAVDQTDLQAVSTTLQALTRQLAGTTKETRDEQK